MEAELPLGRRKGLVVAEVDKGGDRRNLCVSDNLEPLSDPPDDTWSERPPAPRIRERPDRVADRGWTMTDLDFRVAVIAEWAQFAHDGLLNVLGSWTICGSPNSRASRPSLSS